jgi:hypothetical protein
MADVSQFDIDNLFANSPKPATKSAPVKPVFKFNFKNIPQSSPAPGCLLSQDELDMVFALNKHQIS